MRRVCDPVRRRATGPDRQIAGRAEFPVTGPAAYAML